MTKRSCQKIIFTIWYLLAWNLISLLLLKSSTFKKYSKSFCDKMIVLYEGCKLLLRTWHYSLTTLVYHILYSHFYQHPYHCCNWLFLRFISLHPLSQNVLLSILERSIAKVQQHRKKELNLINLVVFFASWRYRDIQFQYKVYALIQWHNTLHKFSTSYRLWNKRL